MKQIYQRLMAIDERVTGVIHAVAPNLNSYMMIFVYLSMGFMIGHFFNMGVFWLGGTLMLVYVFVHRVNDEILDRYDATVHEQYTTRITSRLAELIILAGAGTSPSVDPRLGFTVMTLYMIAFFAGFYTEKDFQLDEYQFFLFRPGMFYILVPTGLLAYFEPQVMIGGLVAVGILFLGAFIEETRTFITPVAKEDEKEA